MGWDKAFQIITIISLVAWAILILTPRNWRIQAIPNYILPLGLSIFYTILAVAFLPEFYGAYSTLENFKKLRQVEGIAIVGWIHIQLLNLFVGCWIAKEANEMGISRLAQAPVLLLTVFFAPVGFLIFRMIKLRQPEEIFV